MGLHAYLRRAIGEMTDEILPLGEGLGIDEGVRMIRGMKSTSDLLMASVAICQTHHQEDSLRPHAKTCSFGRECPERESVLPNPRTVIQVGNVMRFFPTR